MGQNILSNFSLLLTTKHLMDGSVLISHDLFVKYMIK